MDTLHPVDQIAAAPKMNPATYGFTSSRDIIQAFASHGWNPVSTQVGMSRLNKGYQKHLVRLENPAFDRIEGLSDGNASRPQLVLLNSHDGSTSLQLFWGLIRMACLNGIIAGTSLACFRLIHSRKITEKLPEAISYMLSNFPALMDQVRRLQGLTFSESAVQELIRRAYDRRLQGVGKVLNVDYRLPTPLRSADVAMDAFTVFNRVQEVMIRGGIRYRAERNVLDVEGNVVGVRTIDSKTRKLSSVGQQVSLNRLVYDSAIELAA